MAVNQGRDWCLSKYGPVIGGSESEQRLVSVKVWTCY